ncbi:heterokaryon incompatibility protein-domain-containing protein [Colletotrichum godetiae]|uniref:Heterokaryon incompatibility protein-domain-containing protein n=1 Tax=Colletotrichum godetiae TaxID=1209918 RepID=A0AAJ0F1R1_9PEZI|nr:heterokaryon incompatibility protein-domain-containing protein [Colletotrichum godetiae]KAK1699914.1 heterokaryon incompatibility protein-domain-containing protein [Colletotrichum godetiae]
MKRGPDDEPPARLGPRMDSQDTLGTMSKWLDDCVQNHRESHIGHASCIPKLHSYRNLPKTFRNTITLAHHLNIRHIWIDSLCILQDSPLDWKKESFRMDHVYSNSTCNIIAAQSEESDGGLFAMRDPSVLETFVVCSERTDIPSGQYTVWDHMSILNDYNRAPLYKRGWSFKSAYSPREVFISAKTKSLEILPDGIPVVPDSEVVEHGKAVTRIRRMRLLVDSSPGDSPEDDDFFADIWERLVEEYSGCSLTYEKDRLAALNGMAGLFSDASLSRYISGIWNIHVTRQTCWSLNPAAEKKPRPSHPAPFWSWASVQGKSLIQGHHE